MKKIFVLSLMILFFAAGASAQGRICAPRGHRITRAERMDLRGDAARLHRTEVRAHADGFVGPLERRRIKHEKRELRREAFIYRHNRHNRII